MVKKRKKIKLYLFITFLTIFFIVFLYLISKPYNYTKTYKVNKYEVQESYDKKKGYYTFLIKDKNITYAYLIKNKYTRRRELIDNIEEYQNEEETCIIPSSKLIFNPLCSKDGNVYAYNLSNLKIENLKEEKIKSLNQKYENIDINYLNNKNYALFNYRGFIYLNNNQKNILNLFNNDLYNIDLLYQMAEYLIIPNYNEKYYFSTIYVIDLKTGTKEEIKLDTKIAFDSLFLGDYKNKIYLLDKKEEKEYRLDLKKKKLEEIDYLILENNKLVKKDYKEIVNKNLNFINKDYPEYIIKDDNLYKVIANNLIKLSSSKVTKIIKVEDDKIYYLQENNLMMHDGIKEILLLSNFEWNFNNSNMIFIY